MKSNNEWNQLRILFQSHPDIPEGWRRQDFDLFFEVEFGLFAYERIVPTEIERSCDKASVLFSGYFMQDVHIGDDEKKWSSLSRRVLQYVRSSTAWSNWLRWYTDQPINIRLYDVDLSNDNFQPRRTSVVMKQDRLEAYAHKLNTSEGKTKERKTNWAGVGRYTFEARGELYEISISEQLASYTAHEEKNIGSRIKDKRQPIVIDFDNLRAPAVELSALDPSRDWESWLTAVELALIDSGILQDGQRRFVISDVFHLVGRVGAGKSTLIQLMCFYLAKQGKHITIIANTVVEAARLANWFRKVGIKATPALGTNLQAHRLKYGQANHDELSPEIVFHPHAQAIPALNWFTGSCALSGMTAKPIPVDSLPCYRLQDEQGQNHICPLLSICSIHRVQRDLIDSEIWIVNPYSFLYSRAPERLGYGDVHLFEAASRHSDLLIVDEADRVQVQWDRLFAPVNDLAGSDTSLLDVLHISMASQSMGRHGRQRIKRTHYQRLKDLDNQSNMLSDHILSLLFKNPDLVKWVKRRQLTNVDMYERLSNELARENFNPNAHINEDVKNRLSEEFEIYWGDPLTRERGDLSEWVTEIVVRSADMRPDVPIENLKSWLQKLVPWEVSESPHSDAVVLRLQFALLLTALTKRANDILHQLSWAGSELGQTMSGEFQLPDTLFDIIPEPPLGNILGLRYFDNEIDQSGSLKYLRYLGIGRWFLLNFHNLYDNVLDVDGPHIFLTSATSWAPDSSFYHIAHQPNAILSPPKGETVISEEDLVTVEFRPLPTTDGFLRVSGTQGRRSQNLREMTRRLAQSSSMTISPIQQELGHWNGERRVLLVVGSYKDAGIVWETLESLPEWNGRSVRLLPDDSEVIEEGSIFAREVEKLRQYKAEVLIAPLLAIQRGFNILDDWEGALLGSAFFLVRPYPVPDDISQHIVSLNAWAMKQLTNGRFLNEKYAGLGLKALGEYRRLAYAEWHTRLNSGQYGLDSIDKFLYPEFLWNQFVVVWQTIGRLIRGGRAARIFFIDEAFHPQNQNRKILKDWLLMLKSEFESEDAVHRELMNRLYGPAYAALKKIEMSLGETING